MPTHPTPSSSKLPKPDWSYWRKRGFAEVTNAALLSLNLEPRGGVKTALKKWPKKYDEYLVRCDQLRQAIDDGSIPQVRKTPASARQGQQFVTLRGLCEFADQAGWAARSHLVSLLEQIKRSEARLSSRPLEQLPNAIPLSALQSSADIEASKAPPNVEATAHTEPSTPKTILYQGDASSAEDELDPHAAVRGYKTAWQVRIQPVDATH